MSKLFGIGIEQSSDDTKNRHRTLKISSVTYILLGAAVAPPRGDNYTHRILVPYWPEKKWIGFNRKLIA